MAPKGRVIVPASQSFKLLFTRIRDRNTCNRDFAWYSDRLMR
jgi:hypothetical protein